MKIHLVVNAVARGLRDLAGVDITEFPFDSTIDSKLRLAKDRINQGLIDMSDLEEEYRSFKTPEAIYDYLIHHRPKENLGFVHGDYCLPNIFVDENHNISFIDLGRAGIGDPYQDLALAVRSLKHNFHTDEYAPLLFDSLGITPDWEKINYYILMDELF